MGQPSSLPPSGWAFNSPACRSVKGLADRVVGLVGLGQIGLIVTDYLTRSRPDPLRQAKPRPRSRAEGLISNTPRWMI